MPIKNTAAAISSARPRPAFCSIDDWLIISGMGRRATYDALGEGHLKAIKRGTRTLIDVDHGLAWLRSLPPAKIRAPRRGQPSAVTDGEAA